MGNYFKVKKYVSIIFFAPWITIAIVVNILDIVAAVHFGFDMRKMGVSITNCNHKLYINILYYLVSC